MRADDADIVVSSYGEQDIMYGDVVEIEISVAPLYIFFRVHVPHREVSVGIPMTLRAVGIDDSRIDEMARHIADNEGLDKAWVPLHEEDIAAILRDCL